MRDEVSTYSFTYLKTEKSFLQTRFPACTFSILFVPCRTHISASGATGHGRVSCSSVHSG